MRDPRPCHGRDGLLVQRVAVVVAQQLPEQLVQRIGRDRLIVLDEPMRLQLEIREQHLRIERARDAVDRVLQQDGPFVRAIGRARA